MLKELKQMAEENQALAGQWKVATIATMATSKMTLEGTAPSSQDDTEDTKSPADQDTGSAPVVMIRNVLKRAGGGGTRLSYHGIDGLLGLGLFSRSEAINLLEMYVS